MTNIFIFGINGKMGSLTKELALKDSDICVVGGAYKKDNECVLEYFEPSLRIKDEANLRVKDEYTPTKNTPKVDVIIDFSACDAYNDVVRLCKKHNCRVIVASTGHTTSQIDSFRDLAKTLPVMIAPNLSIGVNSFIRIVEFATQALNDSEIEIVEYHHSKKADCPSGTAKQICNSIIAKNHELYSILRTTKRNKSEIGISSVRCGSIVGRHDVIFGLENETITLTHNAINKQTFAIGAIKASKWLNSKPNGLYTMNDYMNEVVFT